MWCCLFKEVKKGLAEIGSGKFEPLEPRPPTSLHQSEEEQRAEVEEQLHPSQIRPAWDIVKQAEEVVNQVPERVSSCKEG